MLKLCYLADADSIHTRKWVDYFAKLGHEIHLISMRETNYEFCDNVYVYVIKPKINQKFGYFFLLNSIRSLVKKIKPDILHSHYASSYGLFGRACNFHPFIVSVWGSDVYEFPNLNKLNNILLSFILRGADTICSTSSNMAMETKKYCDNKEIELTPFGVDIEKFVNINEIMKNTSVTIGVVKSLEEVYGINYLIEAFSQLQNMYKDKNLKLMIVGNGSQKENLVQQCKKLEILSNVIFTGSIDNREVPEYINKMDIVCIPSLSESFGVSAVEACACGRPVISTNVGGLTEIVIDNYNGFTVNPKDSNSIVEKLDYLINNVDEAVRMSFNARRVVEEKYNWLENAKDMEKLYDKLVAKRGKHDA